MATRARVLPQQQHLLPPTKTRRRQPRRSSIPEENLLRCACGARTPAPTGASPATKFTCKKCTDAIRRADAEEIQEDDLHRIFEDAQSPQRRPATTESVPGMRQTCRSTKDLLEADQQMFPPTIGINTAAIRARLRIENADSEVASFIHGVLKGYFTVAEVESTIGITALEFADLCREFPDHIKDLTVVAMKRAAMLQEFRKRMKLIKKVTAPG